ncbi:Uncharacterised protein [Shewanella morhuae]|uniref:Uncharacterized protein n=1 Tax=Shewanella morhuae TaxID=365591 RepID=A0A380AAJ5_9GAMM|nr:Uncharacterised protein [Shewanella morhuae]
MLLGSFFCLYFNTIMPNAYRFKSTSRTFLSTDTTTLRHHYF